MSDTLSPEIMEAEQIESERFEMKKTAERLLRAAFADVLPAEDLEHRLTAIKDTVFLNETDYQHFITEHPEEACSDGVIRVEPTTTDVRRYAVIKQQTSHAETLHTLLHETTHLMSPESHRVFNPVHQEKDEQTYSVYNGALRHEHFVMSGKVDPLSINFDKIIARNLFWESITDWHADEVLRDELTEEEKSEIETTGYLERHYIAYLVDHAPDRDAFIHAIREAYTMGSEDPFRWGLQKIAGRQDDAFYEELLDVLAMKKEDWKPRIDAWMETVNRYFSSTKK